MKKEHKLKVLDGLYKTLRFKIGEQFEKYEFDLTSLKRIKLGEHIYDVFKYDKDDFGTLFDIEIKRDIHLFFNADILCAVIYRFQDEHFYHLVNEVNDLLPPNIKMIRHIYDVHYCIKRAKHQLSEDEVLFVKSYKKANKTVLGYYNNQFYENLGEDVYFKDKTFDENVLVTELESFYNTTISLDEFSIFYLKYKKSIDDSDSENSNFFSILDNLKEVIELKDNLQLSKKALEDYYLLNTNNEESLIDWMIKYEKKDFSMSYSFYQESFVKVHDYCFHISSIDGNIIIDFSKYKELYDFPRIYWNHFWEFDKKYQPIKEHFDKYVFNLKLSEYLKAHGLFKDITDKYNPDKLKLRSDVDL